jgi:hypothetical protein
MVEKAVKLSRISARGLEKNRTLHKNGEGCGTRQFKITGQKLGNVRHSKVKDNFFTNHPRHAMQPVSYWGNLPVKLVPLGAALASICGVGEMT